MPSHFDFPLGSHSDIYDALNDEAINPSGGEIAVEASCVNIVGAIAREPRNGTSPKTGLWKAWREDPEFQRVMEATFSLAFGEGMMGRFSILDACFDSLRPSSELKESLNEFNRQSSIVGQILPVEDALKVLDIPQGYGVKIGLTICECRKLWGGLDEMVCMHFQPVCDLIAKRTLPVEKYHRYVDPEEAKDITRRASQRGCVQWVSGVPIPYVMNVCNCEFPYCVPLRNHLFPQLYGPALKSHYIGHRYAECNES
jgi:hypothetical protein